MEASTENIRKLAAPHIDSFNFMISEGLSECVKKLKALTFLLPCSSDQVSFAIKGVKLGYPMINGRKLYPAECRQSSSTYKAACVMNFEWSINGVVQGEETRKLGEIPIMVMSSLCHLNNMHPKELVKHQEEEQEFGGYFIVKGNEKVIRLLIATRRNYPVAMSRPSWKQRGPQFSNYGIQVRCVKKDETSTNNILHFIENGTAKLMFSYAKELFFAPLMMVLKALCNVTDKYIFDTLIAGKEDDTYYRGCIANMMRELQKDKLYTYEGCRNYIGRNFRSKIGWLAPCESDADVCDFLIKECMLIHLDKNVDKFNLLIYMTKKLWSVVKGECQAEGADCVMNQELTLPGHLYLQILKDSLEGWLRSAQASVLKRAKDVGSSFTLNKVELTKCLNKTISIQLIMENFLATGTVSGRSQVLLSQNTGLCVIAENLNRMRYMSHFRAVHRGQFFTEMRTTDVRRLLPDAWGFICPVHTPDGAPCGLLNHLSYDCQVVTKSISDDFVISLLFTHLSIISVNEPLSHLTEEVHPIMFNGKILGYIPFSQQQSAIETLREIKISDSQLQKSLEIVLVPKQEVCGQYPGIYLFSSPARMMRPVINLKHKCLEHIGTMEQTYLNIAVTKEEIIPMLTTHIEISQTSFLSNIAKLIPLPDFNQSPRNMYQCQMGKQTMGTPSHNIKGRPESKVYRLLTPQSPLFKTDHYDSIGLDDYPMGTNAIVAVISYTGYDMEDAMIINKSSMERGFAHGCIYKSEFVDLCQLTGNKKENMKYRFERDPCAKDLEDKLEEDGLPAIGAVLCTGDPYYSYYDEISKRYKVVWYKGQEVAVVDNLKLTPSPINESISQVCITLRIQRNPMVGDKFASRAGQKGICSHLWPSEDLPFTESGMVPDIVFNPHGFPSRMTIAMMIECMAGKSATVHGVSHDATPFVFNEDNTADVYFGDLLEKAGYNYHGTETMYSGVDGRQLTAEIFFGVIYYQRLRHMVSDKWQVRSTGPIDPLTRQPIKGRKRGGGIRFGEMERDSLLSHGASFLLQDRLFHCSDKAKESVCVKCGSILSPILHISDEELVRTSTLRPTPVCSVCPDGVIASIEIPYVFKYLVSQLSAMNIKVQLRFPDTV